MEISINIFGKTSFWFDYGLKTTTTSLETHDGLELGWYIIHLIIYFLIILVWYYILSNLSLISVYNFPLGIFFSYNCFFLTKWCSSLLQGLVSFIKCFVVGYKCVYLETPAFVSSSSKVDGNPNIEQILSFVIIFYQRHFQYWLV